MPVSLGAEDLERKLVAARRGGYCFEQNMLFERRLEALGAEVELMLARVRWGAPPGVVRPRSHLVLRVEADGASWHADVGFGLGTLLEPMPFGAGGDARAGRLALPRRRGRRASSCCRSPTRAGWVDQYGFSPSRCRSSTSRPATG